MFRIGRYLFLLLYGNLEYSGNETGSRGQRAGWVLGLMYVVEQKSTGVTIIIISNIYSLPGLGLGA